MKKSSPKSTSSLFGSFKSKKSEPIPVANGNAKEYPKKVLHLNGDKGDVTIKQESDGAVSISRVAEALYIDENGEEQNNRSRSETATVSEADNSSQSAVSQEEPILSASPNAEPCFAAEITKSIEPNNLKYVQDFIDNEANRDEQAFSDIIEENYKNVAEKVSEIINPHSEETFSGQNDEEDAVPIPALPIAVCPGPVPRTSGTPKGEGSFQLRNEKSRLKKKTSRAFIKYHPFLTRTPTTDSNNNTKSSDYSSTIKCNVAKADQPDNTVISRIPEACLAHVPHFHKDTNESSTDSSQFPSNFEEVTPKGTFSLPIESSTDSSKFGNTIDEVIPRRPFSLPREFTTDSLKFGNTIDEVLPGKTHPMPEICSGYTNQSTPIPIDEVVEIHNKHVEEENEVIRTNFDITESTLNRDESVGKCGVMTGEFVDKKTLEGSLMTGCTEKAIYRRVKVCGGYLMLESTEIGEHIEVKTADICNKIKTTSDTCNKDEITSNVHDNIETTTDVSNKIRSTVDVSDNIEIIADVCNKTENTIINNTEAPRNKVCDVETVDYCSEDFEDEICSDVEEDETCCHDHQRTVRKNSCCFNDDVDVYNVNHGYGHGRIHHSDANHKYSTKHVDREVEIFDDYNQRTACNNKNCECDDIQSVDINEREVTHKKNSGRCYTTPSDNYRHREFIDCSEKKIHKKRNLTNDLLVNIVENEKRRRSIECECHDHDKAVQSNIRTCKGKSIHGKNEKKHADSARKIKHNHEQQVYKHHDTVTPVCGENKKNMNRKVSDECHDRENRHRDVEIRKNSHEKSAGKNRHCDEKETIRISKGNSSHDQKDSTKCVESDRKVRNRHLNYTENRRCRVLADEEYYNHQAIKRNRQHDLSVFQDYPTNCCNLCDASNETIRYGRIETSQYCRSGTSTKLWNNMKKSASIWDNTKIEIEVIPINDIANIAVNSEVLITAKFTNPLSTHLSNGRFYIQAPSLEEQYCFEIDHISVGEEVVCKALMHPKNHGYEFIVARFCSSEIKKIVGFTNIKVESTAMVMRTSCRYVK